MRDALLDAVLERDALAELDPAARRLALRELVAREVGEGELAATVAELSDAIDGYGPLTRFMHDPLVTDVLVNGPGVVWVERDGALVATDVAFSGEEDLRALVDRLLGPTGARADAARPIADARLADGSRLHVVLPPLAPGGPLLSLRRFPQRRFALDDLVNEAMLDRDQATALAECVVSRRSVVISGATGSGKTTLLNALLSLIPPTQRVVTIEELPELCPDHPHVASLVARAPNVEGAGAIDLDDLVRAALRMRPDRIVVGEVRGAEALAALGAMSTGHEGSMVTVHARSPDDALERLVTLALQARSGASEGALGRTVLRAVDVVVQLGRGPDGKRVVRVVEDVA